MASSSSPHRGNDEFGNFSGIEPPVKRRMARETSRLYDVFINHRGPDLKNNLALHLYKSVEEVNIRAFLDSEEKERGVSFTSTIETAIRSAAVHIAIFSKGYAESPWCLEELVLISQTRAKIIPVFYQVEQWELHYIEKGAYADAFNRYREKSRYLDKLDEWKEALRSISSIVGIEIGRSFKISDGQDILSAVQKEIRRKKSLLVAKYPVGLHEFVKDFERACLDKVREDFEGHQYRINKGDKEKAQIIGIFGMGGVGKTTLAKELFNRKRSQYSRSCFLFDVREAHVNRNFHSVQMKFLNDLFLKYRLNFQSTEEGKTHIANCIEMSNHSSFLIVIDDIDHRQQLDDLLIMDILNKAVNSLVIVTTRDAGVLERSGITVVYNLKGMDWDDARELFCWHAFGQPHPAEDFKDLVDSFLIVCGGLPLSLQVIGSQVHDRDQCFWGSELVKISKTLPRDIRNRLKISFDALDYEEKQIFMDLACFFVDKSKSIAMEAWKASGWSAHQALETLKNKCLVQEIEDIILCDRIGEQRFSLRMHNHLRDLGREMAAELSPRRLWRPEDLEYLESNGFRGILAQTKGRCRCFHSFIDKSLRCRITYLLGESDASIDKSPFLLWLDLEYMDCQNQHQLMLDSHPSIPSSIPHHKLQYLTIRNLRLENLCQSPAKAPSHLRKLHIKTDVEVVNFMREEVMLREVFESLSDHFEWLRWDSFSLRHLPSWLTLRNLSVLELHGANELAELWVDKADAPLQLRELIITGTWSACFERFPKSISNLIHLEKIELIGDVGKEFGIKGLPEEFCDLQSLVHLELRHCSFLSSLPARFGNLRSLRHLDLCFCKELRMLPNSFKQLRRLEHLDLSGCKRLALQRDILENITELMNLNLSKCLKLRQLPRQIADQTRLRELHLQDTSLDFVLPNIGQLRKLELLTIGSPFLKSLPVSLGDMSSLKSLSIIDCIDLESLPETLGSLTQLEHLCVKSSGVRSLPKGLTGLINLQTLKVSGCPLDELDFGSGSSCQLRNLRVIEISETRGVRISITEDCCPRLQTLHISRNDYLEEIKILPLTGKKKMPEYEDF